MCYHFTYFVGKDSPHVCYLVVSRLLPLVAKYAMYRVLFINFNILHRRASFKLHALRRKKKHLTTDKAKLL